MSPSFPLFSGHSPLFRLVVLLSCFFLPSLFATAQADTISYSHSIQPIFDHKCIACHACYDSPCQLNLSSGSGASRGATKAIVYDASRTKAGQPTRLFYDASTNEEWRQKGFYSVFANPQEGQQAALLAQMVELGRAANIPANAKVPGNIVLGVDREEMCPADQKEFDKYAKKHPQEGMPLAVAGLSDEEYQTLKEWLAQGGRVDSKPRVATAAEQKEVKEWEDFLNRKGLREQLVARWIYEHLFLAHLYFSDIKGSQFFEVVRSHTAPGKRIKLIATQMPNDDPQGPVYYRLRPVQGTIVFKTHIVFPLSPEKLARTEQQFFTGDWKVDKLPGYDDNAKANPFVTFDAVPAQARYQFMLDNAEYFVRTFIRGPVCRGQLATDVIRDNFWAVFQEPKRDLYLTNAQFHADATPLLGLPGQQDGVLDLAPQWLKYRNMRNKYQTLRQDAYAANEPEGAHFGDIWNGEGSNDNALLSIFRHNNSASVRKGLIGEVPQTIWVMDYPLFERTYYGLVANFDVFGSVSHRLQTRLYFDLIRNGAEMNFLRLMPPDERKKLIADWYQNSGKLKMWMDYQDPDYKSPTAESYDTTNPKNEFAMRLLQRYSGINAHPDPINRCGGGHYCARAGEPEYIQRADQAFSEIAAVPAKELPVVNWLPEISLVRVFNANGQREIYSLMRNRAHSNVAFIVGEDLRYQPEKDTLTIYPGVLGSYPNFAFNVPAAEIEAFVNALEGAKSEQDFTAVVEHWGVRRTNPEFWTYFHDFTAYLEEKEPVEAGVLDMNRWQNL